jgi:hypothetical protein
MNTEKLTRRELLAALPAAALGGSAAFQARAAEPASATTVLDRFWIFTVVPGGDNDYLERAGVRGGSRMTPAEGAFYLGVPNLIMVRSESQPTLPSREKPWKARTSFEQYATSFRPLRRVVWSIVSSGGAFKGDELGPVRELAEKFPNIHGVYLDDFIVNRKKAADGRTVGEPALSPEALQKLRSRFKVGGRRLESWLTLYNFEVNPKHPKHVFCDPPLESWLANFDVLTLWTWNSDELVDLDASLAALEAVCPKTSRKALGIYLWDYHNLKQIPPELMRKQCETGLKWMKQGRIQEMIFLANTLLDLGFESAEWTRNWIASVANERF